MQSCGGGWDKFRLGNEGADMESELRTLAGKGQEAGGRGTEPSRWGGNRCGVKRQGKSRERVRTGGSEAQQG